MIQNLLVVCGLALSVGVSSLNSNDHNTDSMRTQSTTIYDGGVTTVTTRYQYETNEVNSIDDLVVGNIYKFTILGDSRLNINYFDASFAYFTNTEGTIISMYKSNNSLTVRSKWSSTMSDYHLYIAVGYSSVTDNNLLDNTYYAVYQKTRSDDFMTYINVEASDYLGYEISTATNVMPTSLLEIFDNFINERIFNHSKLATLKTTIFGQEMSVASWLSLSVSIVLGILFLVVLIKGAIWLFKIVGNLALLR